MISNYIKGKTVVLIDASNIYHSQKSLSWLIDFKKLLEYFKQEIELHRIYFYTAYDPNSKKQRGFLDFLELVGYTVRTKKVKFIKDQTKDQGGRFHKGNLDVELTMDAVYTIRDYENFVLFSGDGDFEPLVKFLKAHGKKCLVISSKGHIAIELLKQAKFIDLKKLKPLIERK